MTAIDIGLVRQVGFLNLMEMDTKQFIEVEIKRETLDQEHEVPVIGPNLIYEESVFEGKESNSYEEVEDIKYDNQRATFTYNNKECIQQTFSKTKSNLNTKCKDFSENKISHQNELVQGSCLDKRYSCIVCGKYFMFPSKLARHNRVHTGEKPYSCDICGKTKPRNELYQTMNAQLTIPCNKSEITSNQSCDPKRPEKTHLGKKYYSNNVSETTYYRAGDLNRHNNVLHTVKKSHSIDINKTISLYTKRLKDTKHNIQTDEKAYSGNVSGRISNQSNDLKGQNIIHTGEKQYSCNVCGKSFNTSSNLKRHNTIHNKEMIYSCKFCGESFNKSADLKLHNTRIHIVYFKVYFFNILLYICNLFFNIIKDYISIFVKYFNFSPIFENRIFKMDSKQFIKQELKVEIEDTDPEITVMAVNWQLDTTVPKQENNALSVNQTCSNELKVRLEDVKQLEASDIVSNNMHAEPNNSCKKSKPTFKQSTHMKRSKETISHKKSHLNHNNGATHNQSTGSKEHNTICINEMSDSKSLSGKISTQSSVLNSHKSDETDEKHFSCNICGKVFNTNTNLKVHIRRHTDIRFTNERQ
ncbi:unnamed protein product [Leptidea sinapis]|uniref:C2H2-type domain-containing protein n=1 Tax=Leptidea sinapis TaxID=189913 RepID=A0A5E4QBI6_9NEOP|nr:unnamed protein product [Leptidea sinapis]